MLKNTLLVAALAVGLGACGSGAVATDDSVATLGGPSDGIGAAQTQTEAVDQEQALLDFAACMRDNGVDMADPTVDPDGNIQLSRPGGDGEEGENFDREAVQAAREMCGAFLESAGLGFEAVDLTELEDTMLEYAHCMRDNGYDMPDPDFSDFGPGGGEGDGEPGGRGPFGEIDREDPEFITAQEACDEYLAGFGPGGGVGLGRGQD